MPREGGASSTPRPLSNHQRLGILDYPLSRVMTVFSRSTNGHAATLYFISANSVGVLPVTCRKAWEKAGTLA